eukprot:Skav228476  [mRNA]  locus=scaffold2004:43192:48101:+ [translate_table: standard]
MFLLLVGSDRLPPRLASGQTSKIPGNSDAQEVSVLEDPCFVSFAGLLGEPGAVEATCQQLLSRLRGGSSLRWEELVNMNPTMTLLELGMASPRKAVKIVNQEEVEVKKTCHDRHILVEDKSQDCQGWWRALLARHGLYGPGNVIGAPELSELISTTLRYMRDRQVCKDKVSAPSDLVRSEVIASFEDFNNIYIVLEPMEAVDLVNVLQQWHCTGQGLRVGWLAEIARQLLEAFRHCHEMSLLVAKRKERERRKKGESTEKGKKERVETRKRREGGSRKESKEAVEAPLRDAMLRGTIRVCVPNFVGSGPHSLVHGDLRLTSLLLSSQTDPKKAPELILADLGLAGLPPAPPALEAKAAEPMKLGSFGSLGFDWSQCPSPLLDVWSCGCLIFMLLSGRHPFNGDPGGRLLPSTLYSTLEPDWRMLPSASSASLCAQMLSWDLKSRPSAAECLRHSWLAEDSQDVLPMEALGNLLKSHHKSKLQEITAGLAISEQISSESTRKDLLGMTVSMKEAEAALKSLGMSEKGMEKDPLQHWKHELKHEFHVCLDFSDGRVVLKAFGDEGEPLGSCEGKAFSAAFSCGLLMSHCSELADDLLDHALWRVFSAAGEDHRGVLGAAELEKALQESSSGADTAGGSAPGPFGSFFT